MPRRRSLAASRGCPVGSGPAGTEGLSLASYATTSAHLSRLTSLRPGHVVPVGPSRSRGCGERLGKRQYGGGLYATPHPSPSMDKANLARASQARDPPRSSCGPATGAGSAHGAKLVTSPAHDLTSACSCPAVPWAARPPPRPRASTSFLASVARPTPSRYGIRRGTANPRRRVNRLAGGFREGPTQSRRNRQPPHARKFWAGTKINGSFKMGHKRPVGRFFSPRPLMHRAGTVLRVKTQLLAPGDAPFQVARVSAVSLCVFHEAEKDHRGRDAS